MQHIFLADVHLGAFREEKNKRLEKSLIHLIDYCETNSIQIHLLGDLFDYWMEYKNYTPPLGKRLLARFKEYNRTFNSLFITGNHDFWTRGHFNDSGFRTEQEYSTLKLGGKNILLFHGDGLTNPEFNIPRPLLNSMIRKPWFVDLFQYILSGEAGNHFMKNFSEFTRDEEMIPNRLSEWAEKFLDQSEFNVVITGHDHVPRIETFAGGLYINPGAYHHFGTLAFYTNNTFEIVIWNSERKQLSPFAD
ncbi:MAG: hypothetical protein EA391_09395 [Balneolaceae bacterium]|nr:MAG: hypothetical protein EA391_09395 [Balneolaceae bacterium]